MNKILQELLKDENFLRQVHTKRISYPQNQTILKEGEVHSSFFYIESGGVRISIRTAIEKDHYIHPGISDLMEGEIFGEFCLFEDNVAASADVKTITETTLIEIDKDSFLQFLAVNPEIGYEFVFMTVKLLISRLRKANKSMDHLLSWGMKAHQIDKYL